MSVEGVKASPREPVRRIQLFQNRIENTKLSIEVSVVHLRVKDIEALLASDT